MWTCHLSHFRLQLNCDNQASEAGLAKQYSLSPRTPPAILVQRSRGCAEFSGFEWPISPGNASIVSREHDPHHSALLQPVSDRSIDCVVSLPRRSFAVLATVRMRSSRPASRNRVSNTSLYLYANANRMAGACRMQRVVSRGPNLHMHTNEIEPTSSAALVVL